MRVGNGYDVHALVAGRKLVLGGVEIDWHLGLEGHSDADVLLHAVCDALLGAAAIGDIGKHFPSSDDRFRNIDSRSILQQVGRMLCSECWQINNIDAILVAQRPQLSGYLPQMVENIAGVLAIRPEQVSVKATSTDRLGFAGREEGIAAYAVALISESGDQF